MLAALTYALPFSLLPGLWQPCNLWTSCPHKWVEEQERDGPALYIACWGRLSRAETLEGMMSCCSPQTWMWQPVLQDVTKVHSSWDPSPKCTPLWPSISGFTVQGKNTLARTLVLWRVLMGEGIQTFNNYPEKYIAHIWRELSHELSNFCWKFLLDMTSIVWIYTSFIKDIHSSSTEVLFLPEQHLAAKTSWAFFTF